MSTLKLFKTKFKSSKLSPKVPSVKQNYLNDCHRTYSCIHCRAHLANHDELISKLFQGNHGRAYLFNKVVNTGCRKAVQRELLTGLHAVADIYCDNCKTTLGWKYEQAFAPSQKYKEGKYIIEVVHMLKESDWDLTSYNAQDILDEVESLSENQSQTNNYSIVNRLDWLSKNNSSVTRNEPINMSQSYVNDIEQRQEEESLSNAGSAFVMQDQLNLPESKLNPPFDIQLAAHDEEANSNLDLNVVNKI